MVRKTLSTIKLRIFGLSAWVSWNETSISETRRLNDQCSISFEQGPIPASLSRSYSSRISPAKVTRDCYLARIRGNNFFEVVVATAQICHRPENLAGARYRNSEGRGRVAISGLHGELAV